MGTKRRRGLFNRAWYRIFVLAFGAVILAWMIFVNPPRDRSDLVYERREPPNNLFSEVKFRDVAAEYGVNFRSSLDEVWPSISVIDVNDDGYMDLYVTHGSRAPNALFINHRGRYFTEEADRFGIGDVNGDSPSSFALWGDFDNDGRTDLLLAKRGCHRMYMGRAEGRFQNRSELLAGYCSAPDSVNTADFSHSGRLDLVFGNFVDGVSEDSSVSKVWMQSLRYDDENGGENVLLTNTGHGFRRDPRADFLTRSFTHSVGLSDINLDGFIDIFFANDFSYDQMFLANRDGTYTDVTDRMIPRRYHGMSGMNAEFFDTTNSGRLDLYVSNIHKPPFYRGFNLLWMKTKDGRFQNISNHKGVAKCGFSWAAKFADFNLDAQADLYVVNGRYRDSHVKRPDQGKSMWYERIEVSQIPTVVRDRYDGNSMKDRYISAFERKCLFMKRGPEYFDVAVAAGIENYDEERGMALVDFDNDGRMDMVSTGPAASLKLYHNESEIGPERHWVGFVLKNRHGSVLPHGARAYLVYRSGRRIVREFFPANGYKAFSDPRLHFGLGANTDVLRVEVAWPGQPGVQIYSDFSLDKYNLLTERADDALASDRE